MPCEIQSVSPWIWTRVTVSISNDDNNYTTGISTGYDTRSIFKLSLKPVHNQDTQLRSPWNKYTWEIYELSILPYMSHVVYSISFQTFFVQTFIARHNMRWLTNFYYFRFKWTATARNGIHPTKAWLSQPVNFKNAISTWGHIRRTTCKKLCFKLGKNATETYGMLQTVLEHISWIEHQFLSDIRDSRKAGSLWGRMRGVGGVRKSIHQCWLAKGFGLGLGLLCWGFKGIQEEIPSE